MNRCVVCGATKVVRSTAPIARDVAGRKFKADVPARRCDGCGEVFFSGEILERFELAIAHALTVRGISSGPAFRFIRKALGFRLRDIAPLLDVAPETLSRWETEQRPVDRSAMALLGALADNRLAGRTTTLNRLRALDKPSKGGTRAIKLNLAEMAERVG